MSIARTSPDRPGERQCGRCLHWKPQTSDHFSYNRHRRWWASWCKVCMRAYVRDRKAQQRAAELPRVIRLPIQMDGLPCHLCRAPTNAAGFCLNCGVQNARRAA